MFKVRDLMIHAAPTAEAGRIPPGPIVCYWPSNDCCGPFWSNPVGGGPGNIGTTRWLTAEIPRVVDCVPGTFRPGGCGVNYSTCPAGSVYRLREHLDAVVDPADLKVLRRELDAAVERAKQREGELEEQYTPKTAQEIDHLETQLEGALEELRKRKEQLDD